MFIPFCLKDNKKATVHKCTVAKKTQGKPSTVYRRTSRKDGYAVEFLCSMQTHLKCAPFFRINNGCSLHERWMSVKVLNKKCDNYSMSYCHINHQWAKLLVNFFLQLRPSILQVHRQIEHGFFRCGVFVHAEIAKTLKLITRTNFRRRKMRFYISGKNL